MSGTPVTDRTAFGSDRQQAILPKRQRGWHGLEVGELKAGDRIDNPPHGRGGRRIAPAGNGKRESVGGKLQVGDWAGSVKHGLEQCRQPIDAVGKALAACWQEIAERIGTTSISVQATNIGQQITTDASGSRAFEGEGVT